MSRFFRSPIALIFLAFISLILLWGGVRAYVRDRSVRREIRALEQEITALQSQQLKSKELLGYIKTNSFLEEEARLRLGLQKPGEKVIVISEAQKGAASSSAEALPDVRLSNPKKWWRYFFPAHGVP